MKNVKGHTGYHGCEKCTQQGVWKGRMTFPETDATLRTDEDFNNMIDEDHHVGPSPLKDLSIGMVTQFPLDYMHLVCLGVTRRLISMWTNGPLQVRLGSRVVSRLSKSLVNMKNSVPREFARKPRSLSHRDRYKATEFRQFLLYTGPVVLARAVPDAIYKNFMLLFVGISVLVSPSLCQEYCDYAHDLLVLFVNHYSKLYGKDMVVYNIHGLVHLAQDVKLHGNLDKISAFPFENFLGQLK